MRLSKISGPKHVMGYWFTLLYAHKDDSPVLIENSSWTKINDVLIRTKKNTYVFQFRRVS